MESSDIIKGYEVARGEYIELDPEELEAVALESKRTIEIDEFVPKSQMDELCIRDPYYIAVQAESARGSERRKLSRGEHRASRKTSRVHARP